MTGTVLTRASEGVVQTTSTASNETLDVYGMLMRKGRGLYQSPKLTEWICDNHQIAKHRRYLVKVAHAAAALAGSIVVNVRLVALLLVTGILIQFGVVADHFGHEERD